MHEAATERDEDEKGYQNTNQPAINLFLCSARNHFHILLVFLRNNKLNTTE